MLNAIIFDLDGTMWDSTSCASAIWNRVFSKHKEITLEKTKEKSEQLMGKTMEEIGQILFPDFSEEKRNSIVDEFGKASRRLCSFLKNGGDVSSPPLLFFS